MSSAKLREIFNDAIQPHGYVCTSATLGMARDPETGAEWQRLRFHGKRPDGSDFEYVKLVHGTADVMAKAREVAGDFIGAKP